MRDRFDTTDEVIAEYPVSSNRKKLWVCELDLLEALEKTCQENDINYFLLFGSAIGALRHKGFIPWDDDIDMGMLREDIEKFIRADKKYFPEYVDIQFGISEHRHDMMIRIRDNRTTGIIRDEVDLPGSKGAFIEIQPYDFCDDNFLRKIQISINRILCACIHSHQYGEEGRSLKSRIESTIAKIIGPKRMWNWVSRVAQWQGNKPRKYVDTLSLPNYAAKGNHLFLYEAVKETVMMPYEYTQVRVPKGFDSILTLHYGNYMELPPVEKRGLHHENLVFYDPNRPFTEYAGDHRVKDYFAGDNSLELL